MYTIHADKSNARVGPDKLKQDDMSSTEKEAIDEHAKLVGYAADIILDEAKRREYDTERRKRLGRDRFIEGLEAGVDLS